MVLVGPVDGSKVVFTASNDQDVVVQDLTDGDRTVFPFPEARIVLPVRQDGRQVVLRALLKIEGRSSRRMWVAPIPDLTARLATISWGSGWSDWEGADARWDLFPPVFSSGNLQTSPFVPSRLVVLGSAPGEITLREVPSTRMLDEPEGDLFAAAVPDRREAILGRNHYGLGLVRYDLDGDRVLGETRLPSPVNGESSARWRPGTHELWLGCDGALVRFDAERGEIIDTLELADSRFDNICSLDFDSAGQTCAVGIYRSGLTIGIDVASFRQVSQARVALSLDSILLLDDGRVVAQPWGSDDVVVMDLVPIADE